MTDTANKDKCITFNLGRDNTVAQGLRIYASIGGGTRLQYLVDTGSTGIVVSNKFLSPNNYTLLPDKFFELGYSSSGNTYWGQWIAAKVELTDEFGNSATTRTMHIRMVTRWQEGPNAPTVIDVEKIGVLMMGVGFDRGPRPGPKIQGLNCVLDNINPFILLEDMAPGGTMVPGYILTPTSITLGITEKNSEGFEIVKLERQKPIPHSHHDTPIPSPDWEPPMVEVSVPTSNIAPFSASLLIDTGLGCSFVQAPLGIAPRIDAVMVVNKAGSITTCRTQVADEEEIVVCIPKLSKPLYQFKVGVPGDAPPQFVSWSHNLLKPGNIPFINTGINPLSRLDYLFDEQEGRLGFRFRDWKE